MFKEFEVNGVTYKLRLGAQSCKNLEDKLGHSPLDDVIATESGKIPTVGFMITVLFYSMQKYQHNIKMEDVYNIYDDYIDSGKSMLDLMAVITDIFKVSGFFKDPQNEPVEMAETKKA